MYTFKDNMFVENIEIIHNWGFDGASGQMKYEHRYSDENSEELSDSNFLMTSLIVFKCMGFKTMKK